MNIDNLMSEYIYLEITKISCKKKKIRIDIHIHAHDDILTRNYFSSWVVRYLKWDERRTFN